MWDTNGKDGAFVVDLSKPLDSAALATCGGLCDVVANFGTTEHVEGCQIEAFRSVHLACRRGGLMLHSLPSEGCQNHGVWKYDPEWFSRLANANDYAFHWLGLSEVDHNRYPGPHTYVNVLLQKLDDEPFNEAAWVDPRRG